MQQRPTQMDTQISKMIAMHQVVPLTEVLHHERGTETLTITLLSIFHLDL